MIKRNSLLVVSELGTKEKNPKMKNKKRKLKNPQKTERPPKSARVLVSPEEEVVDEPERVEQSEQRALSQESEEGRPWRNLELIFLIQSKELDQQKFVSLSRCFFAYVL